MNKSFLLISLMFLLPYGIFMAQQPQLPDNYPPGLYDESKVPEYILPDLLITLDGEKVTDSTTWKNKRRPEIIKLFETHVYGRTMVGRPEEMTWEITSEIPQVLDNTVMRKEVTIYFSGTKDGPKMNLHITLPLTVGKPIPLFLIPGWFSHPETLLRRSYGIVNFNPFEIEPDQKDSSYLKSIRNFFAPPEQIRPAPDEWAAIGAWAWAVSRAMDYIATDPDIDPQKVCIAGLSRFGKVVMWAGAQDERFAIIFSGESGCGGTVIVRRGFGETVRSINLYAPHWFNGNFKKYGDRVNDLPVDWHMLVALIAPRPVYIATAEEDYWGDPYGSFLSGKFAESVYLLFGKKGLGVDDMPPVETPIGDYIGFHNRKGGHGLNEYDWGQFLDFADRHFGFIKTEN